VPVRRSRDFAAAARAAGDDVTLIEEPGADHRRLADPRRREWRAIVEWLRARGPSG
jgi:acetyl esterase/lipase